MVASLPITVNEMSNFARIAALPGRAVGWPLLRLGESRLGGRAAALAADRWPTLVPVRWVARTEGAYALLHPLPQYPDHVVVAPRRYVRDLPALVAGQHHEALRHTLDLARRLDRSRPPGGRLFTISTGDRLHVQHVHGHLVPQGDAFWLADDTAYEVARPPASDGDALLGAVGDALERVEGGRRAGSLVFRDLQAERLHVSITVAPRGGAS